MRGAGDRANVTAKLRLAYRLMYEEGPTAKWTPPHEPPDYPVDKQGKTLTMDTLTDAQERVLDLFRTNGRLVGAARTTEAGFVHQATARKLVALGLCSHEVSATGNDVYVLTDAGRARLLSSV